MTSKSLFCVSALGVFVLCARPAASSPVVLDSAWTVAPFAVVPASSPEGVSVDGAGRVYVCAGTAGVFRFDTSGTGALWSNAAGNGQATMPDGRTFVPSRDAFSARYIWNVAPDGSYVPLVSTSPGEGWTWAAVSPSGALYAVIWAGAGEGIYSINIATGTPTPLAIGGPGLIGAGAYKGITTVGENVIVSGTDGVGYGLFSLVGPTLVSIGPTSQLISAICTGPDGIYGSSGDASGGQVWKVASGAATLFAQRFGDTVGVAFDSGRDRFYVLDTSPAKLWVITRTPTATRSVSIGQIKALYK